MSAKHSKKSAKRDIAPADRSTPAPAAAPTPRATSENTVPASNAGPAWIDSTDPRKRTFGKIVLVGIWLYVAALWLLALDQTFHWGIFGPKVPPIP